MKLTFYITFIFIICSNCQLLGQDTIPSNALKDTIPKAFIPGEMNLDSIMSSGDAVQNTTDSLQQFDVSEDAFDKEIMYGAKDSQRVNVLENTIYLYGDAFVNYGNYEIKAGYIEFNFGTKETYASGVKDKLGINSQPPQFSDGSQQMTYKRLRYNFETNKGIIYDAITQQGQLYVHGAVTKFISHGSDSTRSDDQIFNKDALITTCELEQPHYGIRTSKLKIIPNKLAVIGPARLEIAGVPTPLFIPFAFMPVIQGQRSGIIFGGQQGFEFSERLGFGFREIGYYFALNDYVDLKVTGDIYSRGTWGLKVASNYAKRYKYRGNVQVGFSKQILEQEGQLEPNINKSYSFNLSHNQDSKAHPYITIGGNLRFTTNDYDRRNYNDASSQLENIINSNFRFTHSLPGSDAFSLSATIGHSQNTRTSRINFTLPDIQLRMKTIYPFKKNRGGNKEKWYEKFNLSYNSKLKNYVSTFDTILFTKQTLDNLQSGVSHEAQSSASFNVLEYFNLSPSINYRELWLFKYFDRSFDPTISVDPITQDTIYGMVDEGFKTGFKPYRDLSIGLNLSTNIFGTLQFGKGWLRGIRHVIRPSIGLNFTPSTERYLEVVQLDARDSTDVATYNPFSGGIFGTPTIRQKQMALTYSISNIFEGKYYSKKDSTEKKFKIFNNIGLNGSYNFAADSLRWSQVSIRGTARFFKNYTTLTIGAIFDPYMESNNRRTNVSVWSAKKRLLRLESFTARISTGFTISQLRKMIQGDGNPTSSSSRDEDSSSSTSRTRGGTTPRGNGGVGIGNQSILDLLDNFRISHVVDLSVKQTDGVNEFSTRAHSLRLQGSIPLTENWNVQIGNFSYDFKNKSFVYPTLGLTRDLHCWNFNFNWQPQRGTYAFFIGVKTSQLASLLKYNYGRNQFDALF